MRPGTTLPTPPTIVRSWGSCELLEGIQKGSEDYLLDLPQNLGLWTCDTIPLELIYGPLDLSKVRLSPGTLANYQRWERHRKIKTGARGNKHYKTRRLKRRLENYKNHAYQGKYQPEFRGSLWGRYLYRRKKANHAGTPFELTWEEFESIHLNLGNFPESNIPWYQFLGSDKRYSLQMYRLDTKQAWKLDNIAFRYKNNHLAYAKDLIKQPE